MVYWAVHFLDNHIFCIQTIDVCFFSALILLLPSVVSAYVCSQPFVICISYVNIVAADNESCYDFWVSQRCHNVNNFVWRHTLVLRPFFPFVFVFFGIHQETKFANESHLIKCYFFTINFWFAIQRIRLFLYSFVLISFEFYWYNLMLKKVFTNFDTLHNFLSLISLLCRILHTNEAVNDSIS